MTDAQKIHQEKIVKILTPKHLCSESESEIIDQLQDLLEKLSTRRKLQFLSWQMRKIADSDEI